MAGDKSLQTLRLNARARSASFVCDHAVFVGGRKNLWEAMSVVMHRLYIYWSRIFTCVSKI